MIVTRDKGTCLHDIFICAGDGNRWRAFILVQVNLTFGDLASSWGHVPATNWVESAGIAFFQDVDGNRS